MLQILDRELITWQIYKPKETKDFPCMLCHSKIATIRLKCKMKSAMLNLSVCQDCAQLEPVQIMDKIKGGKK